MSVRFRLGAPNGIPENVRPYATMDAPSACGNGFRGWGMAKACSSELRERVIEAVEMGASRREAAELYDVSASSAIKWVQRWRETGSATAKPRGGSVSPLDKFATQILAAIAEQPDRTLVETVAVLRKRRIRTSRSSLWRFLDRHDITFKKNTASR